MPCTDGGFPYPEDRPTKAELKALLCDLCTYVVDGAGVEPYRWPEHIRLWWEQHQREDAERKRQETQDRRAHKAHLRKLRAEIDAELAEE
jgi:hypothetical protein